MVGCGVAHHVGDVDRCDHAEMKGLGRSRKFDAPGELVRVAHPA
jgi:hypothetical protein